jgi:signal transduction histidine kinase
MGDEATTLARFVGDRGFLVLATHDGPFRVGTTVRLRPEDEGVVPELLRTGRPVRVDHHDDHPLASRTWGLPGRAVRSEVAVPIQVDDYTWGLLAVATDGRRLRADAESVLQQLAELVAAALANTQARAEVVGLADEQAALRRLAELAARDAPATDVVQAVAAEAARLVSVEFTTVVRYGRDGSTEVVALSGAPEGIELGMRGAPGGDGAIPRVWRTRRPARIDDLGPMTGSWATRMRGLGYSRTAGAPILIRGELWGALVVVARAELSPHIEDTLARFTDLAGTAISHAQARHDLRVLAHEQAAMRRVAELVARGATLDEVFSAVETEASRLVGSPTVLHRTDPVAAGAGDPWSTTTVPGGLRGLTGPTGVGHTGATEPSGLTVPVNVEGRRWGTIGTATPESELPTGTRQRLEQLGDLAAAAIANAENRVRLTASRARVVATADETRRRLQRDVHDGAQQRLVQTIITLKLALDGVPREDPVHAQLAEALYHAERANADLRDVVHGILPAALTQGGLRTGVQSLIADLGFPVGLDFDAPRLPAEAETTAYFVVAEALTNVVKHAGARRASVEVALRDDGLAIEVVDDGVGGAEPARGSGLTGLSDRVAAADGSLTLVSPPGGGTVVRVLLPVDGGGADPDVGLLRRYGSE